MLHANPNMSDGLFADMLAYNADKVGNVDELQVRIFQEIDDAITQVAEKYGIAKFYVIEEFCIASDWPDAL